MLPLPAVRIWSTFSRFLHKVLIVPYKWDPLGATFCKDSKREKLMYRAFLYQSLAIILYEVFLFYRGAQELFQHDKHFASKIRLLFSIAVYLMMNINEWIIFWNFEHYPSLFQNFWNLCLQNSAGMYHTVMISVTPN